MQNIKLRIDGTRLLIEIDLTDNVGATEKNIIVATTKGDKGVLPYSYSDMTLQLYLTKAYHRDPKVVRRGTHNFVDAARPPIIQYEN